MDIIDDDTEDDWYCDSIKRYGMLVMFEIENEVQEIENASSSSICTLCINNHGQNVLSELILPTKLRTNEVLSKDNDMKIRSGVFLESPTTQIIPIYEQHKVLLSQENIFGLSIYCLSNNLSDQIENCGFLSIPINNPKVSLNYDKLGASKDSSHNSVVVDPKSGKIIFEAELITNENRRELVMPVFVNSNVLALCLQSSGAVYLYDLRIKSSITTFNHGDVSDHWIIESPDISTSGYLGILSNKSILRLTDIRNTSVPVLDFDLGLWNSKTKKSKPKLRFNPSRSSLFSVSGFDENVYIYDHVNGQANIFFKHDGHSHMETCSKDTLTTSHTWYRPGGENALISGAENSSINCWQYNANA